MKRQAIRTMRKFHIGLTQWGYSGWKGTFFADSAKPHSLLKQYASVFNTVEGNTTFYHAPSAESVEQWMQQVPEDFKFCFKFPQLITHQKKLRNAEEDALSFLELFLPWRNKLGPFHLQLGPRFSYSDFEVLDAFLNILPAHLNYAVEVRHLDFYDKGKKEKDLNDLLRSHGMDRVIFDTRRLHSIQSRDPEFRRVQNQKPKMPVRFETSGSFPTVRFVGGNRVIDNEAYLKEWAIILADWIRSGLHPFIFIHTPDTTYAPSLARYFHHELSKLIEIEPLRDWPAERENKQLGLF